MTNPHCFNQHPFSVFSSYIHTKSRRSQIFWVFKHSENQQQITTYTNEHKSAKSPERLILSIEREPIETNTNATELATATTQNDSMGIETTDLETSRETMDAGNGSRHDDSYGENEFSKVVPNTSAPTESAYIRQSPTGEDFAANTSSRENSILFFLSFFQLWSYRYKLGSL